MRIGKWVVIFQEVHNVDAVLKLIGALTGDRRYEEAARTFPEEGTVMRDVMLDRLEEKGT